MIPTPGRIVEYTLNVSDCLRINEGRGTDGSSIKGNSVSPGDTYPMVIVRVWGASVESSVNGRVLLDGEDTLWVTSAAQGDGERKWRPYQRVEA